MTDCVIIGISDSPSPWFPPEVEEIIRIGKVFSGGERHHEVMESYLPVGYKWIDIVPPLGDVFQQYDGVEGRLIVFASGDPLFYGIAATVKRLRPHWILTVYPSFHSLQLLAHRLLLPYHDMRVVSLTGRGWDRLDEALISGERMIGCLTDHQRTPEAIWQRLTDYGFDKHYTMAVGERLGNPLAERVTEDAQSVKGGFQSPNCVMLLQTAVRPRPFGIPEKDFCLLNGRERMITKMPARLLALSMLDLRHRHTLWDVGFCTGSVSIEAKLQFPHLSVIAFEQRPQCEILLQQNSRRHGTPGIRPVMGDFFSVDLDDIPQPDAVFIGGHGGRLKEMIRRVESYMPSGATLVFNAVSDHSKHLFSEGVEAVGMRLEAQTRLAIDDHNVLFIMKAVK